MDSCSEPFDERQMLASTTIRSFGDRGDAKMLNLEVVDLRSKNGGSTSWGGSIRWVAGSLFCSIIDDEDLLLLNEKSSIVCLSDFWIEF